MKLYFSPLACSLATRIVLYEAGADATFEEVDAKTKLTASGRAFEQIHPLGLVPALALDDGEVLTESAAVLQHLARRYPEALLAPTDERGLRRVQQWLGFIGTELHKALFTPLLATRASNDAKSYALTLAESRLGVVERQLRGREFLLDRFSIADAYLFTILSWAAATPVDLRPFPSLGPYLARLRERPSVARALKEELDLYRREQARLAQVAPAPTLSTAQVIERFNRAFLHHEPALLDDLVAEDCLLEDTTPAPLGTRIEGREACLVRWRGIATNRAAHFELEGVEVGGERAEIRWRYTWGNASTDSVRGVNLMRVRGGRIVEARGYVKGAA